MGDYAAETISTLKFADRAKQIMVKVEANAVSAADDALVIKLQKEVQHLKEILNLQMRVHGQQLQCCRRKLHQRQRLMTLNLLQKKYRMKNLKKLLAGRNRKHVSIYNILRCSVFDI